MLLKLGNCEWVWKEIKIAKGQKRVANGDATRSQTMDPLSKLAALELSP